MQLAGEGWRIARVDSRNDVFGLHEWGWSVGIRSSQLNVRRVLALVPLWHVALCETSALRLFGIASKTLPILSDPWDQISEKLAQAPEAGWLVAARRRLLQALRKLQKIRWKIRELLMVV
jgi:hypothetical protein